MFAAKKEQHKYESERLSDDADVVAHDSLSDSDLEPIEITDFEKDLEDFADQDVPKNPQLQLEIEKYFTVFYNKQWYI